MPRPILNIADVEFRAWGHNAGWPAGVNAREDYQAKLGDIGRRLGAQKLGYNVTVIPPRKQGFPLHSHRANEAVALVAIVKPDFAADCRNAQAVAVPGDAFNDAR